MNENIDPELWKAFHELIKPIPEIEIEYRAYYDSAGEIITIIPEPVNTDMPDNCIVVDKAVYENSHKFIILNNQVILKFAEDLGVKPALVKSNKGFMVVKNNPALLIENNEKYTDVEYYEYRNR